MLNRRLKIAIDARPASHPQPGGFKTYVKNLIWGLSVVDQHNEYYIYIDRPTLEGIPALPTRSRVEVVNTRIPVLGVVWREQVLLPWRGLRQHIDVAHFTVGTAPAWHASPKVVTIHDAIEHMPAAVTGASPPKWGTKRSMMHIYSKYAQRRAAQHAALVATVSECSRRDIAKYVGIPAERIRVIPEAPGPQFYPLKTPLEPGDAPADQDPYILAMGSADPRKNLACLISAFASLPVDLIARHKLLLVWTHRALEDRLLGLAREHGILERISSVFMPTDETLSRLYNNATVFVFPSLYEGFGLPPLEAMACGTPVIASNASSLPEVLGEGALLVEPRSVRQLSQALVSVLSDVELRRRLSLQGLARARMFSWQQTAVQTLSLYKEAISRRAVRTLYTPDQS